MRHDSYESTTLPVDHLHLERHMVLTLNFDLDLSKADCLTCMMPNLTVIDLCYLRHLNQRNEWCEQTIQRTNMSTIYFGRGNYTASHDYCAIN